MKSNQFLNALALLVAGMLISGSVHAEGFTSRLTAPYQTPEVPAVAFTDSPRLGDLVRAGRLYLSLDDAIALTIENNLDVEYQRLNRDAARYEILRSQGGGVTRGLN